MKIKLIISFLLAAVSSLFGASLPLSWDAPPQAVSGYKIYYGTNHYGYNQVIDVGNVLNYTVSNLLDNRVYYFAATAYDSIGNESDFSNEASFITSTNTTLTNAPINYVYLGMNVDYGTNLVNLNNKMVMVAQKDAALKYFYRASLLITNKPVIGSRPSDTNKYVYLASALQFGTNLSKITTELYDVMSFTNPPPFQFYRGKLIITNRPFGNIITNSPPINTVVSNINIVNNSFETPAINGDFEYRQIDNWNTNSTSVLAKINGAWPVVSVPDGNQICIIQGSNTLSQQIVSQVSTNYTLKFYAAARGAQDGGQNMSVQLDDIEVYSIAASSLPINTLSLFSKQIFVSQGNHKLSFNFSNNGGDCSDYLDNISLTYP